MNDATLTQDAAMALLASRDFTITFDITTGIFLGHSDALRLTMYGRHPVAVVKALHAAQVLTSEEILAFVQARAATSLEDPPSPPPSSQ